MRRSSEWEDSEHLTSGLPGRATGARPGGTGTRVSSFVCGKVGKPLVWKKGKSFEKMVPE